MSNAKTLTLIEFADALLRFASSDMRLARREGSILIGGTTRGTVALSYERETKTYTLTDSTGSVLTTGRAGATRTALANCYQVE